MEGLFKIDKIDGKGLGWIALREIKASTLIYKEKPQFVTPSDSDSSVSASDLMMSFYAMTENDQKEFLELHNGYLDLNSLDDFDKKWYFDCKNTFEGIEGVPSSEKNLALKVMCIQSTNGFKGRFKAEGGVGIKISRINHSCCPNSQHFEEGDEMEIRAMTKILKGQEITISYLEPMKNFKERQEFCLKQGFVCSCEVCQDEEINKDDETYQKFQNLKEEAESIAPRSLRYLSGPHPFPGFPLLEKALACQKQMYNLAKKKKVSKGFIHDILTRTFEIALSGYGTALGLKNHGKMKYFKGECQNLCKVGLQIAKMCGDPEQARLKQWKGINQDFDNWFCQTSPIGSQTTYDKK